MYGKCVVFWVSRHAILPAQERELMRYLGSFRLVPITGFIHDIKHLVRIISSAPEPRKVVIPILTYSMIRKLLQFTRKEGIEVWYPIMTDVVCGDSSEPIPPFNRDNEVLLTYANGSWCVKRFKCFVRLKDVVLVTEPLGDPHEGEEKQG